MTSEIRTNSLKSRAGMSTVTMTDSGPMFSGITTFVDNSGFTFGVGGGTSIFTPATNVLTFGTNNTEKIRIDANGNANISGITTASNFKTGSSNLHSTGLTVGNALVHSTGINVGTGATVHSPASNVLTLGTNNNERIRIESGGGLKFTGQGTSIPVAGILHHTNNNLYVRGGTSGLILGNQDNTNTIGIFDSNYIRFETNNGTERLRIGDAGQIGLSGENYGSSGQVLTSQGSSSAPTWTTISATTINNNADNRVITGSGTANTLNGEANLTFDSSLVVTDGNGTVTTGGNYINLKRTSGNTNYINAPQSNAELVISADKDIIFRTVHTGDFNSSERARINTSGNVMIGRTDGAKKFSVKESSTSSGVHIAQTIGGSSHVSGYAVGLGFDPEGYSQRNKIAIVAEGTGSGYSRGKLHFLLDNNNNSDEASLNDSRMFITDQGPIGMGAPSTYSDPYRLYLRYYWSASAGYANGLVIDARPDALTTKHIRFYYALHGSGGGSELGSVTSNNAGSVSYNTSSDYRRKKNDVAITDGIEKVKSLRPIRFNWIEQPEITEEGFFAHEAQEVVPNSVFGEKDALDNDGKPDYQVMDHSKLVPLLTASIKDLIAKVEKLEEDNIALRTRVTTLEGN